MPPNRRENKYVRFEEQNGKFYENENFTAILVKSTLFIEFTKEIVLILKRISMNKKRIINHKMEVGAHAYVNINFKTKTQFAAQKKHKNRQLTCRCNMCMCIDCKTRPPMESKKINQINRNGKLTIEYVI